MLYVATVLPLFSGLVNSNPLSLTVLSVQMRPLNCVEYLWLTPLTLS